MIRNIQYIMNRFGRLYYFNILSNSDSQNLQDIRGYVVLPNNYGHLQTISNFMNRRVPMNTALTMYRKGARVFQNGGLD